MIVVSFTQTDVIYFSLDAIWRIEFFSSILGPGLGHTLCPGKRNLLPQSLHIFPQLLDKNVFSVIPFGKSKSCYPKTELEIGIVWHIVTTLIEIKAIK